MAGVYGLANPRVGPPVDRPRSQRRAPRTSFAAHARALAEDESLNFVGNIEGSDVLAGAWPTVIVTDGFTGQTSP